MVCRLEFSRLVSQTVLQLVLHRVLHSVSLLAAVLFCHSAASSSFNDAEDLCQDIFFEDLMPYKDAKRHVRSMQFSSPKAYIQFVLDENPPGLSKAPAKAYPGEFEGWDEFLGLSRRDPAPSIQKNNSPLKEPEIEDAAEETDGGDDFESDSRDLSLGEREDPPPPAAAEYVSYERFVEIIRKENISGQMDYEERRPELEAAEGVTLPSYPPPVYEGLGWEGWAAAAGRAAEDQKRDQTAPQRRSRSSHNKPSYEEFIRILKTEGVLGKTDYRRKRKELEAKYGVSLPFNPQRHYAGKGWQGWHIITGRVQRAAPRQKIDIPPLDEFVRICQAEGVRGKTDYRNRRKALMEKLGISLPANPQRRYAGEGWQGWHIITGRAKLRRKEDMPSYEEFVRICQAEGIKSSRDYSRRRKELEAKYGVSLPFNVDRVYAGKGWTGWHVITGRHKWGRSEDMPPYAAFVRICRAKAVQGRMDYRRRKPILEKELGVSLPSDPAKRYAGEGWEGWHVITGRPQRGRAADMPPFEEFVRICKAKGVRGKMDYYHRKASLEKELNVTLPAHPAEVYAGKGWTGWGAITGAGARELSEGGHSGG